jgi:negative regulator of sigma E activity
MKSIRLILSVPTAVGVLLIMALSFSHFAVAQDEKDADSLLNRALNLLKTSEASKTRFTYSRLEHQRTFNTKGKQIGEITRLFEVTYLFDLEYTRLLEINGKPLQGRILEAEQKRYSDAYNQRKGLNAQQRSELAKGKFKNVTFHMGELLTVYDNRVIGHEVVSGRNCVVIDAMPKASVSDAPKRHAVLWIDPANGEMLEFAFDLLADEDDLLKGSKGSFRMQSIHGVSVDTEQHLDYLLLAKKGKKDVVRLVEDVTLDNYKEFSSISRIVSAEADQNK